VRIGSIVIDVKDFDRMRDFWQKALDYREGRPPEPGDPFPATILKDPNGKGPNVTIDRMDPYHGALHLDLYTDDPEREVEKLLHLGATLYRSREPGEDFVVLADPEGAFFGVVHTDAGDPPDVFPPYDTWFWLELWAKDAPAMAEFYRPIGDYTVTRREGPNDRTELHLVAGGYPRAGILELKHKDRPATWLPYVRVQDLQKTVASVTRAGGRVVMAPNPEVRDGTVAVFLDPLGAAVAAVEWPDENGGEGKP
jgi:predicted enzyme related to lactoylglutathione lyase